MIEHRFQLACTTATPLRLSSGDGSEFADTAVRRGVDGSFVIPGTSLAGVLRSLVERLSARTCCIDEGPGRRGDAACGCAACGLMGDVRVGSRAALPSRVLVRDAVLTGANLRVSDGVAIERVRRAAADARKFDQEEIAPGATLTIAIIGRDLSADELAWVGAALRLIGAGELPLGGRVAQGFGRLAGASPTCRRRNLSTASHVLAAVVHGSDADAAWPEAVEPFPGKDVRLPGATAIEFEAMIATDATLLVADPAEATATGFDRAPRGGAAAPELPGTSFRGVLRSQAERILRSLSENAACDPTDGNDCCVSSERRARKHGQPFERCLACHLFGNEEWAGWLQIRVDRVDGGRPVPFDHVAIDRFTGGARDRLKFDALATRGATWRVRLEITDVPDGDRAWVRGLLALALGDIHDGRARLGHGGARGHGHLRIKGAPDFGEPLEPCVRALWNKVGAKHPAPEARP